MSDRLEPGTALLTSRYTPDQWSAQPGTKYLLTIVQEAEGDEPSFRIENMPIIGWRLFDDGSSFPLMVEQPRKSQGFDGILFPDGTVYCLWEQKTFQTYADFELEIGRIFGPGEEVEPPAGTLTAIREKIGLVEAVVRTAAVVSGTANPHFDNLADPRIEPGATVAPLDYDPDAPEPAAFVSTTFVAPEESKSSAARAFDMARTQNEKSPMIAPGGAVAGGPTIELPAAKPAARTLPEDETDLL